MHALARDYLHDFCRVARRYSASVTGTVKRGSSHSSGGREHIGHAILRQGEPLAALAAAVLAEPALEHTHSGTHLPRLLTSLTGVDFKAGGMGAKGGDGKRKPVYRAAEVDALPTLDKTVAALEHCAGGAELVVLVGSDDGVPLADALSARLPAPIAAEHAPANRRNKHVQQLARRTETSDPNFEPLAGRAVVLMTSRLKIGR